MSRKLAGHDGYRTVDRKGGISIGNSAGEKTGLSRGFFYKNPEVRSRLDAAVQSPNVSCRRIWSESKDSKNDNTEALQMDIMEYKVRNRSLSQENEELRGQIEELKVQVEKLKSRIKKKELSMLKKL